MSNGTPGFEDRELQLLFDEVSGLRRVDAKEPVEIPRVAVYVTAVATIGFIAASILRSWQEGNIEPSFVSWPTVLVIAIASDVTVGRKAGKLRFVLFGFWFALGFLIVPESSDNWARSVSSGFLGVAYALFSVTVTSELRSSNRTLHKAVLLLETSTDGIHVLARNGDLLFANSAFMHGLGYPSGSGELRNVGQWDLSFGPEDGAKFEDLFGKAVDAAVRVERVHRRKDGATTEVEILVRTSADGAYLFCSSRDISERNEQHRKMEQIVREENDLWDSGFDGLFLSFPPNWSIEKPNRALLEMAGSEHSNGLSQIRVGQLAAWSSMPSGISTDMFIAQTLERVVAGENVGPIEWESHSLDGLRTIAMEIGLTRIEYQGRVGVCFAVRNIGDRKRAESASRQLEGLQHAFEDQERFLTSVSHEVRSPLNGVLGALELLEQTRLTSEQWEATEMMRSSAASILNVVDNVLEAQRLDSGSRSAVLEAYLLSDVLAVAISMFRYEADNKGLKLVAITDEHSSAKHVESLIGDKSGLLQVVVNLVANAVKYTDRGEVILTGWVDVNDGENATVSVSVRDTGRGMTDQELERVFDRFVQAPSESGHFGDGFGLGLDLSRRLTASMDGTLEVESRVGQGSTFTVSVPCRTGSEAALPLIPPASPAESESSGSKGRVLVVDDSRTNRIVVSAQLESLGFSVVATGSVDEGFSRIEEEKFVCALVDLRMPVTDGVEFASILRARGARSGSAELPLIAYTASVSVRERQRCEEAGFNGFIPKPATRAQLEECLGAVAFGERDTRSEDVGPEPRLGIEVLSGEIGSESARMVATSWLAELPGRLDAIETACVDGDCATVEREAHTLKSTSALFGADRMSAIAAVIEGAARSGAVPDADVVADLKAAAGLVASALDRGIASGGHPA